LQGCYEQTTPGANDAITGPGSETSDSSGKTGGHTGDAIAISLHPMSQSVHTAESFTLNVSATGKKVLRYQWRKNGRIIRDAVRSSYTIESASAGDAGTYDVIIRSGKRSVKSKLAR